MNYPSVNSNAAADHGNTVTVSFFLVVFSYYRNEVYHICTAHQPCTFFSVSRETVMHTNPQDMLTKLSPVEKRYYVFAYTHLLFK